MALTALRGTEATAQVPESSTQIAVAAGQRNSEKSRRAGRKLPKNEVMPPFLSTPTNGFSKTWSYRVTVWALVDIPTFALSGGANVPVETLRRFWWQMVRILNARCF